MYKAQGKIRDTFAQYPMSRTTVTYRHANVAGIWAGWGRVQRHAKATGYIRQNGADEKKNGKQNA